ncbi:MAG: hypothetical protein ACTSU5_21140 [Promethearchaeota archaeon]
MDSKKKKILLGIFVGISIFILLNCIQFIFPEQERVLKSRADAIPRDAVKVTPQTDQHPPVLNASFKSIWEDPVPLGAPINTAGGEDSPFITPDGKTFFFWFTPDVNKPAGETINDGSTGIYWAKKGTSGWNEPERIFFGWDSLEACPTFYDNQLWFCSTGAGATMKMRVSNYDGLNWSDPVDADQVLGKSYQLGELHLADGGNSICLVWPENPPWMTRGTCTSRTTSGTTKTTGCSKPTSTSAIGNERKW